MGRMWLDLAGAPEPTSSDADATDAEQDAVPAHDAGAPAGTSRTTPPARHRISGPC
ncbi:hypothetical protein [Micrococcus luteus]|uniref:hypothetical protein n=1 Tax=Micrococcus luteus TaxID=1270 RepID=UPI001E313EF0|nr:hypothetical protein [Micrococcus luteus]